MNREGSVENLCSLQEHDIVHQCLEHQRAALTPVGVGGDGRIEAAFDLAEDGFDLSTLAVQFASLAMLEGARHAAAEVLTRQFVSRATMFEGRAKGDANLY